MIALDFSPGAHGHFLSFVVNQYIFDVKLPSTNIFQRSGAAHAINVDPVFQGRQMVCHGHYSYFDYPYPNDTNGVIWIKHDPKLDFILLTNIFHRCHPNAVQGTDVNIEDIKKLHKDMMFQQEERLHKLRGNWYTKLCENHLRNTLIIQDSDITRFDFDYASFFDLTAFVYELSRCADFCGMKLNFCQELVDLYEKFLDINQGFEKWCKGHQLLRDIMTDKYSTIDADDWQLQSFINYNISKIFKIHDGSLFDDDVYPADTCQISKIIQEFQETYDSRF